MTYKAKEAYRKYYEIHGDPKTPKQVASYGLDAARCTGRTHAMIMALPNEPCVIVAHSHVWGKAIIESVRWLRPSYDHRNITIATKEDFEIDPISVMSGRQMPIFVDNAVTDMLALEYVERLNEAYGPRTQVLDLDKIMMQEIMDAANESTWIPRGQYYMNDIIADICSFLRTGKGING